MVQVAFFLQFLCERQEVQQQHQQQYKLVIFLGNGVLWDVAQLAMAQEPLDLPCKLWKTGLIQFNQHSLTLSRRRRGAPARRSRRSCAKAWLSATSRGSRIPAMAAWCSTPMQQRRQPWGQEHKSCYVELMEPFL